MEVPMDFCMLQATKVKSSGSKLQFSQHSNGGLLAEKVSGQKAAESFCPAPRLGHRGWVNGQWGMMRIFLGGLVWGVMVVSFGNFGCLTARFSNIHQSSLLAVG